MPQHTSGTLVAVSVIGNSIVVSHGSDPNTTHSVSSTASISLKVGNAAAKSATLGELLAGDELSYSGDPISTLTATR